MKRTTLSLIAGTTALAAVTGFAAITAPSASGSGAAKPAARLPVEQTRLLCPEPSTSDIADTTYTSFTPLAQGTDGGGKAQLVAAGEQSADASGSSQSGRAARTARAARARRSPMRPP